MLLRFCKGGIGTEASIRSYYAYMLSESRRPGFLFCPAHQSSLKLDRIELLFDDYRLSRQVRCEQFTIHDAVNIAISDEAVMIAILTQKEMDGAPEKYRNDISFHRLQRSTAEIAPMRDHEFDF
jgi:hypothetical protein